MQRGQGGWRGALGKVLGLLGVLAVAAMGCASSPAVEGGSGGRGAADVAGHGGAATEGSGEVVFAAQLSASPWVVSAAFSTDGRQLFFATADGAVWELDTSAGAIEPRGRIEGGGALSLVHGGQVMIQSVPLVRVFNVRQGAELLRLPDWEADLIATSPNGEHLLVGQSNRLGRWNLASQAISTVSGERVEEFINRQLAESVVTLAQPATGLDVGDSSTFVFAFDGDGKKGTLQVWRPEAPEVLQTVGRTNATVRLLALSPDEQRVVAINHDHSMVVAPTTKQAFETWSVKKQAHGATWLDDGTLVLLEADGTTRAYDPASGTVKWELHTARPLLACWSTAERLACSDGHTMHLVHATTGERIAWATAFDGKPLLALPDGSHVGTVPAAWVSRADGSSVDASAWSGLEAPARVLRALQVW